MSNMEDTLMALQKRQYEHDKNHHQDIFNISYPDRMNHYVLHFSKYVGRLSSEYEDRDELREALEKTISDSFIVALAAANTLNLDLQDELDSKFHTGSGKVEAIAEDLDESGPQELTKVRSWLFKELASPAGEMSNAMESLDHMEPINTRGILEEQTVQVSAILLIATNRLEADLSHLLGQRWSEIEDESIL